MKTIWIRGRKITYILERGYICHVIKQSGFMPAFTNPEYEVEKKLNLLIANN